MNGAVVSVVKIECATILDDAQSVCSGPGLSIRIVLEHAPRGAGERVFARIHLVDLDYCAGGVERAVPGEVMTFLVHVDHGGGPAFPAVVIVDIWNGSRIVHAEIATDIHAAIGGDMVFEVTVRDQDAAEHGSSRVVMRFLPVARAFSCDATTNGHLGGILEVPHDLLRGSGIGGLLFGSRSLGIAVTNLEIVPPESPAGMEIDITTTNVHHDRGITWNVSEIEIDTTIAIGGKLRCIDVKDLHGGCSIAGESDELFSI